MNERASDNAEKRAKVDRWGNVPARPGFLRGRVKNMRYSEGVASPYGPTIVLDFDLSCEDGSPEVPVQMTGTNFQGRVADIDPIDVEDPDPRIRPIMTERVRDIDE